MQVRRLCDEVEMLKRLTHENIVRYKGQRLDLPHRCLYIFMELVSGGSLSQLIRNYGPLPDRLVSNYTRQVPDLAINLIAPLTSGTDRVRIAIPSR